MSLPWEHLSMDHLLRDSCSWEARTGDSQDATTLDDGSTYAAAVTLACNISQPSRRWQTRWPDADMTGTIEVWLPHDSTVAARDRITHAGLAYYVIDVADWRGAGRSALCDRMQGVTV